MGPYLTPYRTHNSDWVKNLNMVIPWVVQWLGLHAFASMGLGSISGRGTKIPSSHAAKTKQTKTRKQTKQKS